MAQGYARVLGNGAHEALSAALEAHGRNPRAVAVTAEDGVDISEQASTRVAARVRARAAVVLTGCGHADEQCPIVGPGARKAHWPLPDPARAEGNADEIMTEFRRVRHAIRHRVDALIHEHQPAGR
jgi:arsenate reductase